jgi:hypothetical protein
MVCEVFIGRKNWITNQKFITKGSLQRIISIDREKSNASTG